MNCSSYLNLPLKMGLPLATRKLWRDLDGRFPRHMSQCTNPEEKRKKRTKIKEFLKTTFRYWSFKMKQCFFFPLSKEALFYTLTFTWKVFRICLKKTIFSLHKINVQTLETDEITFMNLPSKSSWPFFQLRCFLIFVCWQLTYVIVFI